MSSPRWWRRCGCALAAAVLLMPSVAAAPAGDLNDVLERFDQVQQTLRTFSAEFTETTRSALLKEPIVARGRFYMTKPDSVRWEYTSPEEMRFVIAANEYTGYFPEQKRAERRDIHRWREQMFRFLGLGQASVELSEFYDIGMGEPAAAMSHTYLLRLTPKKKRVRKRLEDVQLWIDRTSYMPVRVEYSSKSGTKRLIEFERVKLNPDLSASLYRVEIPADVPITTGFSALSGFSPASGRN